MNMLKTYLLLASMTAIFMVIGLMIGGSGGMMIAFGIACAMNVWTYWFSDSAVLKMYGAQPLEHGPIVDMVAELAANAELPMPKVYMMSTDQPNAFATGRNPQNAAVAVTRGITQTLSPQELRGVIAHELAHIKNRDTLTMTITATLAGALGMLSNMAMFMGGSRERPANPIAMIAMMILAPLAASIVQMAISRTREYSADRMGAEIARDPLALASALQKIEYVASGVDNNVAENNPATAHMFIINPLHARAVDGLFSTHPKTANRIAALEEYATEMGLSASQTETYSPTNPQYAQEDSPFKNRTISE